MLKKYRKTLIITTLVMLLPLVAGIILWNRLPDQLATHFDASGTPNGFSSRTFAVLGIPALLILLHWLCAFGSLRFDPKAENLEGKVMGLVLWICPVISIVMSVIVLGNGLGYHVAAEVVVPLLVGVVIVVIGNWLPKCKQTWTLGIKLPWTLEDEDNWNRTHRFAAPIWVVCGLIIMASSFLAPLRMWLVGGALVVVLVAPTVYSYRLFRSKHK
ncbi:MAG: SdpI family protein [Clostridiales bacterium]|nr:SdpI family protein [Clostridiales bacterium]